MKYYNLYYDDEMVERVLNHAHYLVDEMCTIREVAKHFKTCKSTVHHDLAVKLEKIDSDLYDEVQIMLQLNSEESTLRGGMATAKKYKK